MKSFQVLDLEGIPEERYDVALFASGYESRCIHVPGLINPVNVDHPLVFGFTEEAHAGNRDRNDIFFKERWNCDPIMLSGNNEKPIYQYLHEHTNSLERPIRILLDYSAMSRLWYAAVLNWARFAAKSNEVVIDFVYATGKYDKEPRPMVIREMMSLPGCEGRAYHLRESVAVFGLGFNGLAALCVLDYLEADTVYAFLASPGSVVEYVARTREVNGELIDGYKTRGVFELPLSSVETCYRHLAGIIAPHRPDGEITLIPMGPKPHVLASILVAMRFQEVACLRVSGEPECWEVKPTGEIVVTRVILKGES